jgi:arylformamidase
MDIPLFNWQLATPAEVDHQYSPSQHAKRPLPEYLAEYHEKSALHQAESLHLPHAPLLIYIHGGYWQKLSASDSLFNASDAIEHNVALHAVEYTIAPAASIEIMVNESIADVLHIIKKLSPSHVVLAGCSAGAHLAAMCLRNQDIASVVNAAVLLSGIYDLRPLVVTSTNEPLGLDANRAASLSPQLLPMNVVPTQALLAVGQHESSEFIRQNQEYGNALQNAGTQAEVVVVENRDHFDLPYDLLHRGTVVGDWTLRRLGRNFS